MTASSITRIRRCLAIAFPHFSTDRLRRTPQGKFYGWPDERPLVIAEKIANALTLAAVDKAAFGLGLRCGLALADARARIPDLAVAEGDAKADAALMEKIADWCDRYTPFVSHPAQGGLVLDITGCAHLFGGEEAMLRDVMGHLTGFGFCISGVIAGNADAARALARFAQSGIVVPGEDRGAVEPLPIAPLGIDQATAVALRRAGLKTIGDLASRPREPLAARFGASLLYRLDRILGDVEAPISPRRIVPIARAERNFFDPLVRMEDVLAVLGQLAQDLAVNLEGHGQGGRCFEASLFHVDGHVRRLAITTARATRDPAILGRLFAERLDTLSEPLDAGFGFELVRLSALLTEPMAQPQTPLEADASEALAPEAITEFIERLSIRLGAEHVLRFVAADSHIPERATQQVPALALANPQSWPRSKDEGEPPSRPMSLFNPPRPIEALAAVPDGPPLRFRWRRVLHQVVHAEGPERIAPEWWRGAKETLTRDYYRVEDREGGRFWVFREGLYEREAATPRWFIHGLFA